MTLQRFLALLHNPGLHAIALALIFWLTPVKLGIADSVSYLILAMQ